LGRVGVWSITLSQESASFEREAAAEVERLGFGTLWVGELPKSKEALAHSAILLGATQRLMVAAGIANIWARDAIAASNGANALAEAFGRRFLLGLGVSHSPLVSTRGHHRGGTAQWRAGGSSAPQTTPPPTAPVSIPRPELSLHGEVFHLEILVDAFESALAAKTGLLDPAERGGRVGDQSAIEPDHSGLQRLADP
jgi:hypothetical protein